MSPRTLVSIGFLLLLLGVVACDSGTEQKLELPAEPAPATKTPAPEASRSHNTARRLNGTFEARRTAQIAAKVSGPVRQVHVEVGDRVKEGDRLLDVDASNYALQLEQAEAAIKSVNAQILTLQTEYDRAQRLLEKQAIAPSQVDQLKGQLDAVTAQREASQVSAKMARKARTDAVVRAPFDGVITEVKVAVGEFAAAGPSALFTLVEQDVVLTVRVPEDLSGRFSVGDTITADLPAQGRSVEAEIERINPILSTSSRSFDVIAKLKTPDETIQPGMFAEVALERPAQAEEASQ